MLNSSRKKKLSPSLLLDLTSAMIVAAPRAEACRVQCSTSAGDALAMARSLALDEGGRLAGSDHGRSPEHTGRGRGGRRPAIP
jgi:hypothetical protein